MTAIPPIQSPQAVPPVSVRPHRGTMILVFGILGVVCCFIFAIVAWVMGYGDLKEIKARRMDPAGEGMTKAGMILGIVGCVLGMLGIVLGMMGVFAGVFSQHSMR